MKIGINARLLDGPQTGIAKYISRLYSCLLETDPDNEYVFFRRKGANPAVFDNFLVGALALKDSCDVFWGTANILPFFKTPGQKFVVTIHDLAFLRYPEMYGTIFSIYYRLVVNWTLKNADAIIAVSNQTKKDILKYYKIDKSNVRVVYSGVDKIFFKHIKSQPKISGKYFFSLTTHPRRKNIYSVLKAMTETNELKDFKYIIAGLIPERQKRELEDFITKFQLSKQVRILGYVQQDELINLYQHASFFVYPSYYEGFGFPVLEAMASSCPVIASGNSSMSEFFRDNRFLINPFDVNDIRQKLIDMSELPSEQRKKIIDQNLYIAKQFTWEKTAKQMKYLFNKLK